MAMLIKRATSPYWYARFQVAGRDRWLSTGKEDKRDARKELKRLINNAKDESNLDKLVDRVIQCLEKLGGQEKELRRDEVVRRILHTQDRKIEIAKGWEAWRGQANKEYDQKESTLTGYEAIWDRFVAWAAEQKLAYLHEVTHESAEQYAADLWKSKVSSSTYNAHKKFLRSAFGSLRKKAGLMANPWDDIKTKKKVHAEGRRRLTLTELQTILGKATGNLRVMFALGLFTGLRLADVVNLKWSNIDFKGGVLTCKPIKTSRMPDKKVELPLHAALVAILKTHKKSAKGEYLFPVERAAHAENASNVTEGMQAFFEGCGIKTTEQAEHGQRRRAIVRVGFHSLRHSFVSLCAGAGTPLHVVQKLVGHGNPMLTADVYVHLDQEQRRQAIDSLPEFNPTKVITSR